MREHGHAGLSLDLIAHEFRHFSGNIHVGYLGFSGARVFGLDAQVGNRVFQTVLESAQISADFVLGNNGALQTFQSVLRRRLRRDGVAGASGCRVVADAKRGSCGFAD